MFMKQLYFSVFTRSFEYWRLQGPLCSVRACVRVCVMGVSGTINKSADQVFSLSVIIKVRVVVSRFILKLIDLLATVMRNNQLHILLQNDIVRNHDML